MRFFIKGMISLMAGIFTLCYTIYKSITMGYTLSPFVNPHSFDSGGFGALLFCSGIIFYGIYCLYVAFDSFYNKTERIQPVYPITQNNGEIKIPPQIIDELRELVKRGDKVGALKQLQILTGSDLDSSLYYIDNLGK